MNFRSVLALMAGLACSISASGNQIVAPSSFTNAEASSSSSGVLLGSSRTLQYVYGASQLGLSAGDLLGGLSFRLNGTQATNGALTWTNYDIQLSQSLFSPGSLDNVFANNIASDAVTVRSGALSFATGAFPSGGSPNAFGPTIWFSNFYVYTGGDLLVTIRHTGNTQGSSVFADSAPNASGLYEGQGSAGYTASSFTAGQSVTNTAIVMDFVVVPEPGTSSLVVGGVLLAVSGLVRKRRSLRSDIRR